MPPPGYTEYGPEGRGVWVRPSQESRSLEDTLSERYKCKVSYVHSREDGCVRRCAVHSWCPVTRQSRGVPLRGKYARVIECILVSRDWTSADADVVRQRIGKRFEHLFCPDDNSLRSIQRAYVQTCSSIVRQYPGVDVYEIPMITCSEAKLAAVEQKFKGRAKAKRVILRIG